MGNASSMLTQYDIEEVQDHCKHLFSQQDMVDFSSSIGMQRGLFRLMNSYPDFAMNPLFHRLLKMVDGLNFKDFVAFLSAFSSKASMSQKVELIFEVYDSDGSGKVTFNGIIEVIKDLTDPFLSEKQSKYGSVEIFLSLGKRSYCKIFQLDYVVIQCYGILEML